MSTVRSFIAIDLPVEIKREVQILQQELKMMLEGLCKVGWVKTEGFHLTLKFLGNVQVSQIPEIAGTVERVVASFSPFPIDIGGVGVFPNRRAPRVIWVGVKTEGDVLARMQQGIEEALCPLGFEPENRPFHAHLTIGRVKSTGSGGNSLTSEDILAKWLAQNQDKGCGRFKVREVLLMKSELRPDGAVYTPMARMGLRV